MDDAHWRPYVDARFAALDLRVTEVYNAIQRAVDKAESSMAIRLDGMNEFRASLSDMANRSATRDQLDQLRAEVHREAVRAAQTAAVVALLVSLLTGGGLVLFFK